MGMASNAPAQASNGVLELWSARYDGPTSGPDVARALVVSPDGTKVFVTGNSQRGVADDFGTAAYDSNTGHLVWGARYDGTAGLTDVAYGIAVSPEGTRVFVTGRSDGLTEDFATVAYDAVMGTQLWVRRFDTPLHRDDFADAIAVSPDGSKVFVTGEFGPSFKANYGTVAYGASDGHLLWVNYYDGPGHVQDHASSIAASPDGSKVLVTGWSYGTKDTGYDYATVAYDAESGAQLFVSRYDAAGGSDNAYAVTITPDGSNVLVTGSSFGGASTYADYGTVAYDAATGGELWSNHYSGPGVSLDIAYAVGSSPDGGTVFVTGSSQAASSGLDYATVAYEASGGQELWSTRYTSTGAQDDRALALAVAPNGSSVYVTGESPVMDTLDYATFAYSSVDGARVWAKRYDGSPFHDADRATAVAVTPDGTEVFVTGQSEREPGNPDYVTVAYAA
jgi:PQQ-like domain